MSVTKRRKRRKGGLRAHKDMRAFLVFLAPSLTGVAVFVLMPFLDVFGRSFKTVVTGQFVW